MTLSRPAFIAQLLERYADLRSWRKVAKLYPGVTFQVLNKIALHGIFPKDKKILKLLNVEGQGRRRTPMQKAISELARDTTNAVVRRKPSKKTYMTVEVKK